MKKIIYSIMGLGLLWGATSCDDFLDTSSPSEADVDFVFASSETAKAALQNAYSLWRSSSTVCGAAVPTCTPMVHSMIWW